MKNRRMKAPPATELSVMNDNSSPAIGIPRGPAEEFQPRFPERLEVCPGSGSGDPAFLSPRSCYLLASAGTRLVPSREGILSCCTCMLLQIPQDVTILPLNNFVNSPMTHPLRPIKTKETFHWEVAIRIICTGVDAPNRPE